MKAFSRKKPNKAVQPFKTFLMKWAQEVGLYYKFKEFSVTVKRFMNCMLSVKRYQRGSNRAFLPKLVLKIKMQLSGCLKIKSF